MLETFRKAWKMEDLRKRLLFTLMILVLFRLGCAIPVPYISSGALSGMFSTGSMLTYLNMMSGGALSECTLFALGVQPAINASIIIQLLTVAIPYLENLSKEGEEGRRKLLRIADDGRVILKDTNNSTDDFNPGVVASEIELQGTAMDVDGTPCTQVTYDGVRPVKK